ncbi:MAG: hypothetical protein AVDCRST_MAG16-817, partial [uncultured Frankineae bacterium]
MGKVALLVPGLLLLLMVLLGRLERWLDDADPDVEPRPVRHRRRAARAARSSVAPDVRPAATNGRRRLGAPRRRAGGSAAGAEAVRVAGPRLARRRPRTDRR